MDEIEDNPSEVNSCFRVVEPLKINIADFNKKRKLQAEPLELPTPKHQCWDRIRGFTTGPVSVFGEIDAMNILVKEEGITQFDGSELESAKDSNSMVDDSDTAMSTYYGGKLEASTSSASVNYSSDSFGVSKVSEIQECPNIEEHLIQFEDIEQCTDEELEAILNNNGLSPNKFVLSSGRWSVNQEPQQNTRKPTIDQEFEQYFSMLML